MSNFTVTASGLFVRRVPSSDGNVPLGTMPRGTVYERTGPESDGWAPVRVNLGGRSVVGFASARPDLSAPVAAPPTALSSARFSAERRGRYVASILDDVDRMNFLRPAQQGWEGSRWIHSFAGDDGKTRHVAAEWSAAKRGDLHIVSPTTQGKPIAGHADTFCNFNISFCYHQAYGGPSLQFMDGREWSANDLIDVLSHRWVLVPATEAARIANAGGFVIAAKPAAGHGHVVFLLERSDETGDAMGIRAFHAGAGAPRERMVGNIWNPDGVGVRYIVDPDTHAEWVAEA